MTRRPLAFAAVVLSGILISGCGRAAAEEREAPQTPTLGPNVVHFGGVRDIRFGETTGQLTERGALDAEAHGCGPAFANLPAVSPVFADDRLVLVWMDPPQQTPEGVTVGTPVTKVRTLYSKIEELQAPPKTYRYDGMLVAEGDRAYLFLHDGNKVRKAIIGYAEYVRRLFDDGFGSC
ncbi:hypothetical protein SAMN05444365_101808 [Micromonospora pattaloongensis]|uniref:Lipoprotein n=1 Tax=Micromonospora pattaloongensis TaxID=405436 RepID=A0A1H3HFQ5_9ACTN|nr:hypothetical protein [Micromonospora pattaloongensis]SDY14055.1 hypothetical protein SAMN05444365_101808 [Micromonospora pattaloongensis]